MSERTPLSADTAEPDQGGEKRLTQAAQAFAAERLQDVRRATQAQSEALLRFIKARPAESLLIGVAVGYLLGWIGAAAFRSHRDAASSFRVVPKRFNRRGTGGAMD